MHYKVPVVFEHLKQPAIDSSQFRHSPRLFMKKFSRQSEHCVDVEQVLHPFLQGMHSKKVLESKSTK
jgi:hypothetical protein